MYIRYAYDFEVGRNKHRVELYDEGYDTFVGLIGEPCNKLVKTRYTDIIKELKGQITTEAEERLVSLCKQKLDGIISPEGKYYKI